MIDYRELLQKYQANTCTAEERALVESWLADLHMAAEPSDEALDEQLRSLDRRVLRPMDKIKPMFTTWKLIASIAASLLLFSFTYYFLATKTFDVSEDKAADFVIAAPAADQAKVVLDNKQEVLLSDLAIGDSIVASGYTIKKSKDGSLIYKQRGTVLKVLYNTLVTPAGSTTALTLSDGSKVLLNANSSLTYPITFDSQQREVALSGEAIFAVAKRQVKGQAQPFFVRGASYTIKVLGTTFNANFHTKKPIVALVEGKVAIAASGSKIGEQSTLDYQVQLLPNQVYNGKEVLATEDVMDYLDWREGFFNLNKVTLQELGNALSSWYGVEVVVRANVQDKELVGRLNRKKSLNEVLELVAEVSQVKYSISKNKVEIYK